MARTTQTATPMPTPGRPSLSIIVPMLNEARTLGDLLADLLPYQRGGCEVILVDGGSHDGSPHLARCAGFTVLDAPRGRARQMNAGAAMAHGEVLLFLHADTRLPADADALIAHAMQACDQVWGRFDVRISGRPLMLKVVARLINLRSRLSGIATGDQAMFVCAASFAQLGGFPDQPLMEDIELSRRLKRLSRPACLTPCVITSGRRWETHGVWRTIGLMWRLRLAYWLGASPDKLAKAYR
jgi:rSAM/selenodomain-associated transferase 2